MNRAQAIEAAKEGKRITHRYFDKDEYVTYLNGQLIDEKGYYLREPEFWMFRKGDIFDNDWSFYEPQNQTE